MWCVWKRGGGRMVCNLDQREEGDKGAERDKESDFCSAFFNGGIVGSRRINYVSVTMQWT